MLLVETSDAAAPASNAVENLRLFMIIRDSFRDKAHASGESFDAESSILHCHDYVIVGQNRNIFEMPRNNRSRPTKLRMHGHTGRQMGESDAGRTYWR
jgi:hypothetical protein